MNGSIRRKKEIQTETVLFMKMTLGYSYKSPSALFSGEANL
jgi:hypothetical protein